MRTRIHRFAAASFLAALFLSACYYPATLQPPPRERTRTVLQLPYDLALDAVTQVIKAHDYRINANDPTHGIIEAQTAKFSVADADCGVIKTAMGEEPAAPSPDSSAVYTFYIKPKGPEASTVAVQAVFATPLRVPFHPVSSAECVSRGVQEAKLLKEIEQQAAITHRPAYKTPPTESSPTP